MRTSFARVLDLEVWLRPYYWNLYVTHTGQWVEIGAKVLVNHKFGDSPHDSIASRAVEFPPLALPYFVSEPDFEDSSGEEEEDSPDDAVSSDELEEPLSDPDEEVYSPHENELASDEFSSDDDGGKKGRKKVGDKNKKSPKVKPKPSPKRRRRGVKFEDEEETDEEDEDLDLTDSSEPESGNKNFTPRQRPLFRNMHFFLFGDFPDDLEENKLKQVITDLAGWVKYLRFTTSRI